MEEYMSPSDKAAEYFRSILLQKSPNKPYPIVRLVGHRAQAPADVYNAVVNNKDLKALFKNYPELFLVKGSSVSLVKVLELECADDSFQNPVAVGEETWKIFKSVLNNISKFCPYSISELLNQRNNANKPVDCSIRNTLECKSYLKQYPDIFTIYKNYVVLTDSVDHINESVAYLILLLESSPNKECSFNVLMNSPSKPICFNCVVKSTSDLKKLLLCFSNTFKVNDNYVTLVGNQSVIASHCLKKQSTSTSSSDSFELYDNDCSSSISDLVSEVKELKLEIDMIKKTCIEKAAFFFSEKLWTYKFFKVVPIVDLFSHKVTAPAEIKAICGKNIKEFKEFLQRCSDTFIVTGEYVLPRKNIPKKDWCPPSKGVEEELSSVLHNFFKMYTQHGKPLHIEKLFNETGKCFLNARGEKFFETTKDLTEFLGMFPESFYIFSDHVVNIHCFDKDCVKEVSRKKNKRGLKETPAFEQDIDSSDGLDDWKESVLSKTEFITDLETCKAITKDILDNEKLIALDCEGVNLGVDGLLSLIQIGTESGKVYIFDIIEDPNMIIEGNLKAICESTNILKVVHDCRNDSANLYFEFEVLLKYIFDTRIAHGVIIKRHNTPIGFNNLCKIYGAPINVTKDEFKDVYKTNPGFWMNRPLTKNMLAYAALDVACLVPHVYSNMKEKLKGQENKVISLSERASKSYF